METMVVYSDLFISVCAVAFLGVVFAVLFGNLLTYRIAEVKKLRQFINDFVDYNRVDEVLVRRAYQLAENYARVVDLQTAKAKSGGDVAAVEEALEDALKQVRAYKPEFFRPLDELGVAGYKALGGASHKDYLIPSVKGLVGTIDTTRRLIEDELSANLKANHPAEASKS